MNQMILPSNYLSLLQPHNLYKTISRRKGTGTKKLTPSDKVRKAQALPKTTTPSVQLKSHDVWCFFLTSQVRATFLFWDIINVQYHYSK